MRSSGRAVELLVVVCVLAVLVLLSLQSAVTQVRSTLHAAEQGQAALTAAARHQERTVNDALGEQVLVAQAPERLPETPAVQLARSFVGAAEVEVPPLHVPAGVLVTALLLRGLHRGRQARLRRARLRRSVVALSAFSPAAARCAPADARGTVLLPVR